MRVRFWGVRGSIPTPGEKTVEFGGNTSCVEVEAADGNIIILDAGTGIREFGLDYIKRKNSTRTIHLFISHVHWDHIQGMPFFIPLLLSDFTIHFYGNKNMRKHLAAQMKAPYFPLDFNQTQSEKHFHTMKEGGVEVGDCLITPFWLVHPQEVMGFRVQEGSRAVCYSSDTEHEFGEDIDTYIENIRDADILLYDAQYTPEQYDHGRIGWGHSTYEAAVGIAGRAGVKKLVLFHHEPTHDDKTLRSIERKAKKLFKNTISAREGMILEV